MPPPPSPYSHHHTAQNTTSNRSSSTSGNDFGKSTNGKRKSSIIDTTNNKSTRKTSVRVPFKTPNNSFSQTSSQFVASSSTLPRDSIIFPSPFTQDLKHQGEEGHVTEEDEVFLYSDIWDAPEVTPKDAYMEDEAFLYSLEKAYSFNSPSSPSTIAGGGGGVLNGVAVVDENRVQHPIISRGKSLENNGGGVSSSTNYPITAASAAAIESTKVKFQEKEEKVMEKDLDFPESSSPFIELTVESDPVLMTEGGEGEEVVEPPKVEETISFLEGIFIHSKCGGGGRE